MSALSHHRTTASWDSSATNDSPLTQTLTLVPEPKFTIVHVIGDVAPRSGGPASVIVRIAAAQATLGHDVTIVAHLAESEKASFNKAVANIPDFDRVHMVRMASNPGLLSCLSSKCVRTLQTQIKAADVVHIHGVWEPMLLVASAIARRNNIPYIVRPFGTLDPWSLRQRGLKKRIALAVAYRRMLNGAAFIHVLNADEGNLIEPLGLTPPRHVIPNGVFPQEISSLPPRDAFIQRFPQLAGKPYILFLSRLHYKKGLDILAKAFVEVARKNSEVQLVVAGPDDGDRASFEATIKEQGLTNRVHLVGPLYGRDKLAAFAGATCFCLPSRQEGFSVAIVEALACGVPVAVSDSCHFPEVAEVGAGEVFPLDPNAAAESLLRILANPVLRGRMSRAGRLLVNQRFTWPHIGDKTIKHYSQIVTTRESDDAPAPLNEPSVFGRRVRDFVGLARTACTILM